MDISRIPQMPGLGAILVLLVVLAALSCHAQGDQAAPQPQRFRKVLC